MRKQLNEKTNLNEQIIIKKNQKENCSWRSQKPVPKNSKAEKLQISIYIGLFFMPAWKDMLDGVH